MRFIERSPEEIQEIIRDRRGVYTVHVTTASERLDPELPPDKLGWRAHVSVLVSGTSLEKWGFNSDWLFATQADAHNWGYWMAATWLEAYGEKPSDRS